MTLILSLVGLALGSGAELYLGRSYSDMKTTGPLFHCFSRKTWPQGWRLLPLVGYLSGFGPCPRCGRSLAWRALLPPAMATLFALSWLTAGSAGEAWADALMGAVLLLLLFTDLERRLIPNRITYPALPLFLGLSWLNPDVGPLGALAGGGVLFAFMLVVYLASRGGLGAGDVKMAALVGLATGLPAALVGLAVAALLGGAVVLLLLLTGRVRLGQAIPYGPYLAVGGIVALLWGPTIVNWYAG